MRRCIVQHARASVNGPRTILNSFVMKLINLCHSKLAVLPHPHSTLVSLFSSTLALPSFVLKIIIYYNYVHTRDIHAPTYHVSPLAHVNKISERRLLTPSLPSSHSIMWSPYPTTLCNGRSSMSSSCINASSWFFKAGCRYALTNSAGSTASACSSE